MPLGNSRDQDETDELIAVADEDAYNEGVQAENDRIYEIIGQFANGFTSGVLNSKVTVFDALMYLKEKIKR